LGLGGLVHFLERSANDFFDNLVELTSLHMV